MRLILFLLLLFSFCNMSIAQTSVLTIIDSGSNRSIRGLSVVNDKIFWCSGSNGSVGKSFDGGKTIAWLTIPGYEKRDFRDIQAFNKSTAIVMAIGEPAIILKTIDGGISWVKVFEDSTKGMFLDAMDFDKKGNGSIIGDPIDGKLFQAFTNNYGYAWTVSKSISLEKSESFFASSGTNIARTQNKKHPYIFVSGGLISRLFYRNKVYKLDFIKGRESSGANSIAIFKNKAVIVGGDFTNEKNADSNCLLVYLKDELSFIKPKANPTGYKSCVIFYNKNTLISCGTSGIDISYDAGMNWKNISTQSFHVIQKAKKGKTIFLAGSKGKIATLILP